MEAPRLQIATPSRYRWDARSMRYRAPSGRFVSRRAVRDELDHVLDQLAARMKARTDFLRDGKIKLARWQADGAKDIRSLHLLSAAAARGGWDRLSRDDLRLVRDVTRAELGHWLSTAKALASGDISMAEARRRAAMYADAGRKTYHHIARRMAFDRGFDQVRSRRTVRDSCEDCVAQHDAGWQDLEGGGYIPIGERRCRSNCGCYEEYRNVETGEVLSLLGT